MQMPSTQIPPKQTTPTPPTLPHIPPLMPLTESRKRRRDGSRHPIAEAVWILAGEKAVKRKEWIEVKAKSIVAKQIQNWPDKTLARLLKCEVSDDAVDLAIELLKRVHFVCRKKILDVYADKWTNDQKTSFIEKLWARGFFTEKKTTIGYNQFVNHNTNNNNNIDT